GAFLFQAEDGIRAFHVTGVQTCALPIWLGLSQEEWPLTPESYATFDPNSAAALAIAAWDEETVFWGQHEARLPVYSLVDFLTERSEERRVGKGCGSGGGREQGRGRGGRI